MESIGSTADPTWKLHVEDLGFLQEEVSKILCLSKGLNLVRILLQEPMHEEGSFIRIPMNFVKLSLIRCPLDGKEGC